MQFDLFRINFLRLVVHHRFPRDGVTYVLVNMCRNNFAEKTNQLGLS